MRTGAGGRVRWIAASAWLLLVSGCLGSGVGPLKPVRPVCGTCEGEDRYVRLELPGPDASGERAPRFAHPMTLSPKDWRTVLGTLRIQRHDKALSSFVAGRGQIEPVFTEDEIVYLSRTLSQAFARAKTEEWVVFAIMHPQTPEVREVTSGAWFAVGGTLHLRLANYRFSFSMDTVRELVWDHPTRIARRDDFELLAGDFQTLVGEPMKTIPFGRPTSSEVSVDYRALLRAEAAPPSASQKPIGTGRPPVSRPVVEERLHTLEKLKAQGLVTDEEYRAKRKQILDQF